MSQIWNAEFSSVRSSTILDWHYYSKKFQILNVKTRKTEERFFKAAVNVEATKKFKKSSKSGRIANLDSPPVHKIRKEKCSLK